MKPRFIQIDCGTEHAIYQVNSIKRVYFDSDTDYITIEYFDGVSIERDTYYPKSKKKFLKDVFDKLNQEEPEQEEVEEETGKNLEDE